MPARRAPTTTSTEITVTQGGRSSGAIKGGTTGGELGGGGGWPGLGGGDGPGYQNSPEEGGHKRKDVGVDGEAHSLRLGRSSAASSAPPCAVV